MANPTRERITRESVASTMLKGVVRSKRTFLIVALIFAVIFVPSLYFNVQKAVDAITSGSGLPALLFVVPITLLLAFVAVFAFIYCSREAKRERKIKDREFCVRVDKVTYMTERVKWIGRRRRTIKVIEFRDCGEVPLTADLYDAIDIDQVELTQAAYLYTEQGDEFYTVIINGEMKPILIYPCKLYEYKEQ